MTISGENFQTIKDFLKLPDGRTWGCTGAVKIGRDGKSIWALERCGANKCTDSTLAPVLNFNSEGELLTCFGGGLFVFPHGLYIDSDENVWVTDAGGANGKGHRIIKFDPSGNILMSLGTPGVAGNGTEPYLFNGVSDVLIGEGGCIFVADGHGRETNARIIKYSKNGEFIKAWGQKGKAPGEFDTPHTLALDSSGRLFVGDRNNNRIQIFDQDGNFIDQWFQLGRPSGICIDKNDFIYVADSESNSIRNPGWQRGIRIASVRDGVMQGFIPYHEPNPEGVVTSGAEGVAVDALGNIFGAEVGGRQLKKYIRTGN